MDIRKALQPIFNASMGRISSRHVEMLRIEMAVVQLNPDSIETHDMLDAFAIALKLRYPDCTEVLLYMSLLNKALERLDVGYQLDAADTLTSFEAMTRAKKLP